MKVIVLFLYTGAFLPFSVTSPSSLLEFPNATCVVRGAWCMVPGNTVMESFCARTKVIPDRASRVKNGDFGAICAR